MTSSATHLLAGASRRRLVAGAAALATAACPLVGHLVFRGDLRDLDTVNAGPFDGARAKLTLRTGSGTKAVLVVRGIDRAVAGRTFGAHLHIGPCVEGNGAAALGHYNHSTSTPPTVDAQTEIWLDFTVDRLGRARSTTAVDWAPLAGTRSVVVHANPTAPDGTAGPRLACLPVEWS